MYGKSLTMEELDEQPTFQSAGEADRVLISSRRSTGTFFVEQKLGRLKSGNLVVVLSYKRGG